MCHQMIEPRHRHFALCLHSWYIVSWLTVVDHLLYSFITTDEEAQSAFCHSLIRSLLCPPLIFSRCSSLLFRFFSWSLLWSLWSTCLKLWSSVLPLLWIAWLFFLCFEALFSLCSFMFYWLQGPANMLPFDGVPELVGLEMMPLYSGSPVALDIKYTQCNYPLPVWSLCLWSAL